MRVSPVKSYRGPRFPTRGILDAHPELLRLVPKRWHKNPVVLTAVAAACAIVLGYWHAQDQATASTKVAPIFQHGAGRGVFGCEVVNPPVLLSEDEARQVIAEEGTKAGLSFTPKSQTIPSVARPAGSVFTRRARRPRHVPVTLDGTDGRRRVAYEFVSSRDSWTWNLDVSNSSVSEVSTLGAARILARGLGKAHPGGAYAVFYDPMVQAPRVSWSGSGEGDWRARFKEAQDRARAGTQDELRKQVRDFIAWLKAQGVV